jgi:hypothetical protein
MLTAAGVLAHGAMHSWGIEWPLLVFAVVMGVAGIGIGHRSLVAQVLARGAAWLVFLPTVIVSVAGAINGIRPPFALPLLAATTSAALLLARPMLHTKAAREQFAPTMFRRWLLAGSIATAATGLATGGIALATMPRGISVGIAAIAVSLLASSVAVVRMRAWGILLGAVTSMALLIWALVARHANGFALALAAAPSLLLHVLPVLVARSRAHAPEPKVRVDSAAAITPAHYRIVADPSEAETFDGELAPASSRASLRA